jgi:hypothetical protein
VTEKVTGRLEAVVGLLTATVSDLTAERAAEMVTQAAGCGTHTLAALQWHLRDHPDALSSGSSEAPPTVLRLIGLLADAGCDDVVVPRCVDCRQIDRSHRPLGTPVGGGRVCRPCARRRMERCTRCARNAIVWRRTPSGPVCERCWRADPDTTATCSLCGQRGPVGGHYDRRDGISICRRCYGQSKPRCAFCGERRIVAAYLDDGPACPCCHRPRVEPCDRCGESRPVYTRLGEGRQRLCRECAAAGVFGRCAGCGKAGPVFRGRTRGRRPHCPSCWSAATCAGCGLQRKLCVEWPIGSFCRACYAKVRRKVAACPSCGETHPLIGLDPTGQRICGPCAGIDVDYRCAVCGKTGYLIAERTCERCLAAQRARLLLTGAGGTVAEALEPFLHALVNADSPGAVLQWLRPDKPAAGLLARLAARPETLSHETLDGFPQTLALHRLRQSLVHTGVLPGRVDHLERLVPWLENLLADQPAGRAHLVRTYAHWTLLRRARHQAQTSGRFTYGSSDHIRTKLRAVLRLLTWIDTEGFTLEGLNQGQLDCWLVTQPRTSGGAARQFVGWARRAGLTGDIDIPKPRARTTLDPIGEDDRWDHLRRLLTDEQLPLDTRAAGSLVLLYGLPVSRISELRADQLTGRDGHSYLNFGAHSLLLPPAVAVLLERQARHAISVTVLHRSNPTGPPWLFPGGLPGRPARDVLYRKLRAAIPHIRRSRSAALISLAAELPAPILADLLDLNINTAVQWTQHASRDWSHYLQARTGTGREREDHSPVTAPARIEATRR